ncbi:MAG: LPS assembly lipoprotein LptE, partial [Paracoccaceae bacterium]
PTPRDRNTQLFHNRILDRLGHPGGGAHRLNVTLSTTQQGLGTTSDGQTTLYQVSGVARFTLTQDGSGTLLSQGRTEGFTSYSATESTVATLAAETDATARLMTLLADQALDRMTLDMAARGGS